MRPGNVGISGVLAACKHVGGERAIEEVFPEHAAARWILDARLDRRTQFARQPGERAEPLRQERFEALAQSAREHRRIAAATDSDDDRRAIDDRRHDEARQLAIVDDVDRNVTTLGLARDPCVDRALVGRRDRQPHAVQMLRTELRRDVRDLARCCSLRQAGDKLGCNDPDLRGGSQQQIDLAFGNCAAADDEHGLVGETQKYGEVVHRQVATAAVRRGSTLSGITRRRGCMPHSRESGFSHHQRPERGSAPGSIARVQGAQPMLG